MTKDLKELLVKVWRESLAMFFALLFCGLYLGIVPNQNSEAQAEARKEITALVKRNEEIHDKNNWTVIKELRKVCRRLSRNPVEFNDCDR